MAHNPGIRCSVRNSIWDPNVWIFDFDPAAPGGRGGASVAFETTIGLASIAGIHKNGLLPKRSTGALLADGFRQTPMPHPAILEAYNVEKTTRTHMAAGGDGQGTFLGNTLADTAKALGATITYWEPVPDGNIHHLRVHLAYP